jgi:hypothetical protein
MSRITVVSLLLLAATAFCPGARAADEASKPSLAITLDHTKLTQWVLEDFADGLPFDRHGTPTDFDKAKQFWQLLADWPISVNGPVGELRTAIDAISKETGLPIYFGKDAWAKLEAAGAKMKMVTIQDSVQKAVRIIAGLAGVDKVAVTPLGLVVLGPDEDPDDDTLLTAPPANTFRWRESQETAMSRAFPNGIPGEMTRDDQVRMCDAMLERRCDVVVAEPMDVEAFIVWLARAAQVNIATDDGARVLPGAMTLPGEEPVWEEGPLPPGELDDNDEKDRASEAPADARAEDATEPEHRNADDVRDAEPRRIEPMAVRFVTLREAINTALVDVGLVVGEGLPVAVILPRGWKEELEQLRQQDVESTRSDTDSFRQEESSDD